MVTDTALDRLNARLRGTLPASRVVGSPDRAAKGLDDDLADHPLADDATTGDRA
jgi:hypothetical protein